jgi:pimeloyl-ACP methyl ester carboxylesterase
MVGPRWIDVQAPAVELKALTWGPPDGPIALCLHGFPDTAYGWRNFAPRLAEAGWRRPVWPRCQTVHSLTR